MYPVSVVIPVYFSQDSLPQLVARLRNVLRSLDVPYEIILVDDGSQDRSWQVILDLCAKDATIKGLRLARNFGQHNALLCGIQTARYEIIVTIDDDLQNPPEEIPKLLQKIEEGYDVVYGTPEHERHGFLRDLASQVTKGVLQKSMGAKTARQVSAFRAFRAQVREAFADYDGPFVCLDVLLTWGTDQFTAVTVRHEPRAQGRSQYSLKKLIAHTMNMVTGFSTLPLQVASLLGFGLTCFGLFILAYVIWRWIISGSVVPGFPFLASIIAIFSGAQLFTLGIIGEYLARMHFRIMQKPPFVVRTAVGIENKARSAR